MSAGGVLATVAIAGLGLAATLFSSTYTIDEGHVGVIVRMGKAIEQQGPQGLQFKTPFITSVREFDVRERSLSLQINATTSNQLSTNMVVTVNLIPDPARIMEIFVKYGGPEQFFANVVTPRLSQSSKASVGRYSSVQLARERDAVAQGVFAAAVESLEAYPVIISSAQLDDYTLPERYWQAIIDKEEQREKTAKETLLLEQQGVQAQQTVQTAEADRDAAKAAADALAYATRTQAQADADATTLKAEVNAKATLLQAQAEADGIKARAAALARAPEVIEFEKARNWDGALPRMVLGDAPDMLMDMGNAQ